MQSVRHLWRRPAAVAVSAIAALAMLASCSSTPAAPNTASSASTGSATSSDPLAGSSIKVGTFTPLAQQYEVWVSAYQKEYPDRKVELVQVSDDMSKYQQILATQRLSNTMPDLIFNVNGIAQALASKGLVMDMAPMLAEGKDGLKTDAFLPQFVDEYRPTGHPEQITGLPVSADSTALFYVKDYFDKYGVAYPTDQWTWEDMTKAAKEIQAKSKGEVYGMAIASGGGGPVLSGPILQANGVKIYDPATNTTDIDSPNAIKAWKQILSLYPDGTYPYGTDSAGWDIKTGKFAMKIASSAETRPAAKALSELGLTFDVTRVPTINGKHPSGGGSYAWSISATSKNVDAAWAFLAWFYDPEKGSAVAQSPDGGSIIPPTEAGLKGGKWTERDMPAHMAVFAETAKDAVLYPPMPGGSAAVLNGAVKTAIEEVVLKGADVETAFKKAAQTTNEALASEATKK